MERKRAVTIFEYYDYYIAEQETRFDEIEEQNYDDIEAKEPNPSYGE